MSTDALTPQLARKIETSMPDEIDELYLGAEGVAGAKSVMELSCAAGAAPLQAGGAHKMHEAPCMSHAGAEWCLRLAVGAAAGTAPRKAANGRRVCERHVRCPRISTVQRRFWCRLWSLR
jgi:hypothetical protein